MNGRDHIPQTALHRRRTGPSIRNSMGLDPVEMYELLRRHPHLGMPMPLPNPGLYRKLNAIPLRPSC